MEQNHDESGDVGAPPEQSLGRVINLIKLGHSDWGDLHRCHKPVMTAM
jgi:hypothetical protein